MKIIKIAVTTILCLAALLPGMAARSGDKTNQYDYTYSANFIDPSVAGFELAYVIDTDYFPIDLMNVDDIAVGGGRVFIADSLSARVNVLDASDYSYLASIKLIRDNDNRIITDEETGAQMMLVRPEGIYFSEIFGELYIADAGAECILVLDGDSYALRRVIERPDNMPGNTNFIPSKIGVDRSGRIYVVVQGSFEGMLEINPDGSFSRYYGVNKPVVNTLDYIWRTIASRDQREKMAKSFAPAFSNLAIDPEGFVYAVTNDTASEKMIFRFNAKGENVIREEGYVELVGDYTRFYVNSNRPSAFTAIAVTDFGVYAVVDKTYGRVFVYDFDGYVIKIFSKLGNMQGDLRDPSSICWNGYDLLIGDKSLGVVYCYKPTDFGLSALLANEYYSKGQWEAANECFIQSVSLNANYYTAYSGIGRNELMQRNYAQAMYFFELANDKGGWSKAYEGYRAEQLQENFIWILLVILLLVGIIFGSEVRYHKRNREGDIE